jgi:hypothetical protein
MLCLWSNLDHVRGLDALLFAIPDVQLVAHPNDKNAGIDFCQKNPESQREKQ